MTMDYEDDYEDYDETEPTRNELVECMLSNIASIVAELDSYKYAMNANWKLVQKFEKECEGHKKYTTADLDNIEKLEILNTEYSATIDAYIRDAKCCYRSLQLNNDLIDTDDLDISLIKLEKSCDHSLKLFNDFMPQYKKCRDIYAKEYGKFLDPNDFPDLPMI